MEYVRVSMVGDVIKLAKDLVNKLKKSRKKIILNGRFIKVKGLDPDVAKKLLKPTFHLTDEGGIYKGKIKIGKWEDRDTYLIFLMVRDV